MSYGEEIEICCWTSPFDLMTPYDPNCLLLPESPFATEECAAHWDEFCVEEPLYFFPLQREPATLLPERLERPALNLRSETLHFRDSSSLPDTSMSSPPSPRNATTSTTTPSTVLVPQPLAVSISPSPACSSEQYQESSSLKLSPNPLLHFLGSGAEMPPTETPVSSLHPTSVLSTASVPTVPSPIPGNNSIINNRSNSINNNIGGCASSQQRLPIIPTSYLHPPTAITPSTFMMEEEEEVAESNTDSEYAEQASPRQQLSALSMPSQVMESEGTEEDSKSHLANEESKIDLENFKLSSSKSPVIEAFVFCALQNWGVKLKNADSSVIQFEVTDFDYFYERSNRICSKQRPTEDPSARIKGLRRWFPDFPSRRSQISGPFTVSVSNKGKEKAQMVKIKAILEKSSTLVGISKIRKSR